MKKSKIVVLLLSLALLFGVGNNNLKLDQNVGENNNRTIMKAAEDPDSNKAGNITFGTKKVEINAASVTADDSKKNKWTITTVGTTSFTAQPTYYQVGSQKKPATSITFECTLPDEVTITLCSIKLGGFSGTAGAVSIKLDETEVGKGSLNTTNDVTIENTISAACKNITISITGIAKGVKVYSIDYNYSTSDSEIAKANINSSDTKAQLKYSFNVTQEEGVSSFVKVTEEPTDWSGQYLIGYEVTNAIRVLNAGLTEENIQLASNYFDVTTNSNGAIDYSSELYNMTVTLISTNNGYAIKSTANGYYLKGGTSPKGVNTSNTESAHTLTFDSTTKKIKIKDNSGDYLLQYNSGSPRFHYYASKSNQQNVYLYKYTEQASYSFFNMKMNLGAVIEAAKVQALVDAGLSISSYGVAVAQKSNLVDTTISDAVIKNSSYVKVVSADYNNGTKLQKTDANGTATSGDYVIFNADLSFPDESKYNVEVSAVAFFKLEDGTYVFFQERTLSVASLAQEYIDKTDVYNTFDPNVQGSLKALASTTGSVA